MSGTSIIAQISMYLIRWQLNFDPFSLRVNFCTKYIQKYIVKY